MPPNQAELNVWADAYAETFPVVCDEERYIHTFGIKKNKETGKGEVKLPSTTLIAPGMEIIIANKDVVEADIVEALANIAAKP